MFVSSGLFHSACYLPVLSTFSKCSHANLLFESHYFFRPTKTIQLKIIALTLKRGCKDKLVLGTVGKEATHTLQVQMSIVQPQDEISDNIGHTDTL